MHTGLWRRRRLARPKGFAVTQLSKLHWEGVPRTLPPLQNLWAAWGHTEILCLMRAQQPAVRGRADVSEEEKKRKQKKRQKRNKS